jgi:hypothetical protein
VKAAMDASTKDAERLREWMRVRVEGISRRAAQVLAWRGTPWVLLAALGAAYATGYFRHELFPGHADDGVARGWWTWSDQQKYLQEARAIADGRLDRTTYVYPVGYPALGAVFISWMPVNPFFVPNLLLVLGAAAMGWRLARRWLGVVETVAVGMIFVATHGWLVANTMIVPWNTLATQFTLLVGVWLVHARTGIGAVAMLSGLAAAAYVVRPVDAVAFGPLLVYATLRLSTWKARIAAGVLGISMIAAAVAFVGGLNVAIFGQWRTPYEMASMETVGFFGYPISFKLFWLFVDGWPLFGETEPALLWRYPWLFLVLPAAVWWVQREGAAGVAALSAVGVSALLYSNYNDLLPSDIYRFTLLHYLSWWFPLMFVVAWAACRRGWRNGVVRAGFAEAALLLVVCAGLRLEPRALAAQVETIAENAWRLPEARPLLVECAGVPMETVTQLRLDGRPLVEYSQYLVPYVPSELKMLLGRKASGAVLTMEGVTLDEGPNVSEYRWAWRASRKRLSPVFEYRQR